MQVTLECINPIIMETRPIQKLRLVHTLQKYHYLAITLVMEPKINSIEMYFQRKRSEIGQILQFSAFSTTCAPCFFVSLSVSISRN